MPAEVRDAATVLLVRDEPHAQGESALEVFMVRRHADSGFVGGHHVFPGGVVDAADRDPRWAEHSRGSNDPFAVAAVRELLEEAGVLLGADRHSGAPVKLAPDVLTEIARSVHSGDASFLEVCQDRGIDVRLEDLIWWSHWITPVGQPRRYDTRFYVANAPAEQEAVHDELELTAGTWGTPASFLEQHRRGEIQMILPTVANLQSLQPFDSAGDLLAAAAFRGPITPTAPEMRREDDGSITILVDGEPVWTEQAGQS